MYTHHIQAYHTTCMNTRAHLHTNTYMLPLQHNTCASRVCTRTTPPPHTASQHNIPMIQQHTTQHTMHVSRHVYALTLTHVVCAPHTRIQHTTPHHITLLINWSSFSHFGYPSHSGSVPSCVHSWFIPGLPHHGSVSSCVRRYPSTPHLDLSFPFPYSALCYVSFRFSSPFSSLIESCCCCDSRLLFYSRAALCASSLLFSSPSSAVPGVLAGRGIQTGRCEMTST